MLDLLACKEGSTCLVEPYMADCKHLPEDFAFDTDLRPSRDVRAETNVNNRK